MQNLLTFIFFITALVLFVQMIQAKSADEIINRYNEARGGIHALNNLSTLIMEGHREMLGENIPIRITKVQDQLSRTDFLINNLRGFLLIKPAEGWILLPQRSLEPDPLDKETILNMQEELDIPGLLTDYYLKATKIDLQGKEIINGNNAYKIHIKYTSGIETTYLIDCTTYLLVESRHNHYYNSNEKRIQSKNIICYSDYRSVDGILFPNTISTLGDGLLNGKTHFTNIIINSEVEPSYFNIEGHS